ncbi:hypothetical protein [Embleya sp. NPDC001921]
MRAVDTDQLLALQQAAAACGFSQRLEIARLREHLAAGATHHLFPVLVHELGHRPEVSPQWRCRLLPTVGTGERILGLLDVLPDTFDEIPETLDAAAKSEIARRMDRAVSVRGWSDRTAGTATLAGG